MIYLGADHGGFELKEKIKTWLQEWNKPFEDLGAKTIDPVDDYPDFARSVSQKIAENPNENVGILACRSGGGMVIAANRIKNSRAVYVFDAKSAKHARNDNNANVAVFAADWTEESLIKEALQTFLATPFSDVERHQRRVEKIDAV